MRLRCAILDDYLDISMKLADWSKLSQRIDITVFKTPFANQSETIKALQGFQIIGIIRERTPFPRAMFEALPDLKLLVTTGWRNGAVDIVAAKDHGVTFCGTEVYGMPTAALTIGLILELTRKIGTENARLHAGALWQSMLGQDVEGQTLGLLGLGRLGAKVAAIAQAMGMNVIAWSQNLTRERCDEVGVTYASREELFSKADFISIHVVLGQRNRGLVGRDDLNRMKSSAYLINTSRGPIVDEQALLDVLRDRRIAGAGLDVFWAEPLPLDHPLRKMDNVVITPHLGYVTRQNHQSGFTGMVEDIESWLDGKPIRQID